jgi:hypothetical protein
MTLSDSTSKRPVLGYGLGMRTPHYPDILEGDPNVDWFEIISENFMDGGGLPLRNLERVRERFPIVMHGVSMSIGGFDTLDTQYLRRLKDLINRIEPEWISDHLCWTGVRGINMHDLLPLPFTEGAVKHVADRISRVQDFLGRRILMENVSSYITYQPSGQTPHRQPAMTEWEFLTAIVEAADCHILLDINNIYVSSYNHGFDAEDFLKGVPANRIMQFHLAGHTNTGDYIIDTHDHPIVDPVWDLYTKAVSRFGEVSTMIERDDNIPPFAELVAELDRTRSLGEEALKLHSANDHAA